MSTVTKNDVFISYHPLDNQGHDEEVNGWIDNFHKGLGMLLGELLGYEPRIWRDAGSTWREHFLPDYVFKELEQSSAMIPILSPNYVNSERCLIELQEYGRLAHKTRGFALEKRMPI